MQRQQKGAKLPRQKTLRELKKGDAKSCFDAIKEGCSTAAWPIQLVICDVVD